MTLAGSASAQTERIESAPLTARTIPVAGLAIEAPSLAAAIANAAARHEELEKWMDDFSKWKRWADTWGNRREPGWFSGSRARRPRPDPPLWLFEECEDRALDADAPADDACGMLAEWSAGGAALGQTAVSPAVNPASEEEEKITWWEHVHLDAGWPAMQSGVNVFGVLGVHATTTVRGRFQIFVAPGAMLLNVPMRDGGRAWKVATNYGIAFELGQFTFPGTTRQARLHLNLAKAWLFSAGPDVPTSSTDFAGLSITFKKTP